MDAHNFRLVASELAVLLNGARVEKIHGPLPGVYVFTLFAQGHKLRLITRHERQSPLIFFSGKVPANPMRPTGAVMRLRKYCGGRRLTDPKVDFPLRSIAFAVGGPPGEASHFLLLDLVNGAFVVDALPEGFANAPVWPLDEEEVSVIDSVCASGAAVKNDNDDAPWRTYEVLTPFLRQTLRELDPMEGRALVADLEHGAVDLMVFADAQGQPSLYSAWPLPSAQMRRYGVNHLESLFPQGDIDQRELVLSPMDADSPIGVLWPEYPALAIVSLVDERKFFDSLGSASKREEAKPQRKEAKKQARLFAKLDQEETRLQGMLEMRETAMAIQALLWQYGPDEKRAELRISSEDSSTERTIALDPSLTIRDNMARMFKQSARGARGLSMLAARRAQIAAPLLHTVPLDTDTGGALPPVNGSLAEGATGLRELPDLPGQKGYKGVARFQSSDGFTILRGKNASGNHSLLKIGKGHDLWLHVEGGPSAHAIIRRSHASEEVPERTLREAAMLVGQKSWQKNDAKVLVMVALLKHVHGISGAKPGTVKVDRIQQTITVELHGNEDSDPDAAMDHDA